jgi:hypothetical protein
VLQGSPWSSSARQQPTAWMAIVTAVFSVGAASARDPLVEETAGVTLDWRRGVIVATGGAAADLRMPSADASRPGAERRARLAARTMITQALRVLPLGGGRHLDEAEIARALGRARSIGVEYQSNGGALTRMEIAFGDWLEAVRDVPPQRHLAETNGEAAVPLWLPQGRLAASPVVVVAGRELVIHSARYRTAAAPPAGARPLTVHADGKGRLLVEAIGNPPDLTGRPVLIYVRKILR